MTFHFKTEEYYNRFIELQEKLRKSEEERLKLEMKFNEMVQVTREEEQMHYRKLRAQYKRFLEEDRRRQDRNERIARTLERIESRVAMLVAKTERYKLLRQQYHTFLDRIYKDNEVKKPEAPYEQKQKQSEKSKLTDDTNDVVQTYLQNLSSQKLRELLKKEEDARNRLSGTMTTNPDDNYSHGDLYTFSENESRPNYANSIADDIMSSIYRRSSKPVENTKHRQPREFNNNVSWHPKVETKSYPDNYQNTSKIVAEQKHSNTSSDTEDFSETDEVIFKNSNQVNKPSGTNETEVGKIKDDLLNQGLSTIKKMGRVLDDQKLNDFAKRPIEQNSNQKGNIEDKSCYIDNKEEKQDFNREIKDNGVKEEIQAGVQDHQNIVEEDKAGLGENVNQERKQISNENNLLPSCQLNSEEVVEHDQNELSNTGEKVTADDEIKEEQFSQKLESEAMEKVTTPEQIKEEEKVLSVESEPTSVLQESSIKIHPTDDRNLKAVKDEGVDDKQPQEQVVHHEMEEEKLVSPQEGKESGKQAELEGETIQSEEQHNLYDQTQYGENDLTAEQYQPGEIQQYDDNGQPIQIQPYEHDQTIHTQQYDDNGKAIDMQQYDEHGQPVDMQQYDENGQPVNMQQYDESGEPIPIPQYDGDGQPIQMQQYDESQYLQQFDETGQSIQHYDENSQPIQQYDEQGQPLQQQYAENAQYDENGQLIPQYTEQYDEHGQLIQQYDEQAQLIQQFDENGQPIQQYEQHMMQQYADGQQPFQQYDENGQLIQQYDYGQPQYDENGQLVQQYNENEAPYVNEQQYYNHPYSENPDEGIIQQEPASQVSEPEPEKDQNLAAPEESKKANVMEMLDTDTESVKQDTKISHDSDFDFSNG